MIAKIPWAIEFQPPSPHQLHIEILTQENLTMGLSYYQKDKSRRLLGNVEKGFAFLVQEIDAGGNSIFYLFIFP